MISLNKNHTAFVTGVIEVNKRSVIEVYSIKSSKGIHHSTWIEKFGMIGALTYSIKCTEYADHNPNYCLKRSTDGPYFFVIFQKMKF